MGLFFFFFFLNSRMISKTDLLIMGLLMMCCFPPSPSVVDAYKNYTVGDSLGWFDSLEKPNVDYQKWVSSKTFSLGDFLLFNTDNNHSLVQTYNFTTYKRCDYNDALDNDTVQWAASDLSTFSLHPVFVAVPLLKVGMTYFFSSDYDGEQCNNGQRFQINVTYGQGLPKSLQTSPPNGGNSDSLAPTSPMSGDDDESAPDTLVPSNFDHPKEVSNDDSEASTSPSLLVVLKLYGWQLNGMLILLGLICIIR